MTLNKPRGFQNASPPIERKVSYGAYLSMTDVFETDRVRIRHGIKDQAWYVDPVRFANVSRLREDSI